MENKVGNGFTSSLCCGCVSVYATWWFCSSEGFLASQRKWLETQTAGQGQFTRILPSSIWAPKNSFICPLPEPLYTLQADPARSWWASEYLQGFFKTDHQHSECIALSVFLERQTVWEDRIYNQNFLSGTAWILLWDINLYFLSFPSFHTGRWLAWWLIALREECVRTKGRSIPRDFCLCCWKLKHVRIGLWEEVEWLRWLRKERERDFPEIKKKRCPLGWGKRENPVGSQRNRQAESPQGKMVHDVSMDIRPQGPGSPALPEILGSRVWGESSMQNLELKVPHRWMELSGVIDTIDLTLHALALDKILDLWQYRCIELRATLRDRGWSSC